MMRRSSCVSSTSSPLEMVMRLSGIAADARMEAGRPDAGRLEAADVCAGVPAAGARVPATATICTDGDGMGAETLGGDSLAGRVAATASAALVITLRRWRLQRHRQAALGPVYKSQQTSIYSQRNASNVPIQWQFKNGSS